VKTGRTLGAVLATLLLAGCASADKHPAASTQTSATGMAGMSMASGSGGLKPVAIRTLATAYWQDMKIQAQEMTPVPFVVFTGNGGERTFKPPKHASFHLMVMLTDRHTHFQIPYAGVWATITDSAGKVVYNDQQWPMISEYMGTHYGNNVPHLAPGRYTLKLLISPPVAARHLEYAHVWQKQHTVTEHFTWKPPT